MRFTLAALACLAAGAIAATVPAAGDNNIERVGCPGQGSCEYRCYLDCKNDNDKGCYNSCKRSCACNW